MKSWLQIKIRAGSLQFVLFISVVIALLILAFILLSQTHQTFKFSNQKTINAIQETNTLFLTNNSENLSEKPDSTITIKQSTWGIYRTKTIKSPIFDRHALMGNTPNSELPRSALYLKDISRPLVVVGNTKIEGDAFVPKAGIKAGNISGTSYYGERLVNGITRRSIQELPELNANLKSHLKALLNSIPSEENADSRPFVLGTNLANSFGSTTVILYDEDPISLVDEQIIGNVIIKSATSITVSTNAVLKDVILVAPKIVIQNNTKGNFQAIASKTIVVGRNVNLEYPSSLVVIDSDQNDQASFRRTDHKQITIGKQSVIKGSIVFLTKNNNSQYEPQIIIKEASVISGEIYCEKNVELRGTVFGSVYTHSFIAKQSGSIYQNHIYNGGILANELNPNFSGIELENNKQSVAKWLY